MKTTVTKKGHIMAEKRKRFYDGDYAGSKERKSEERRDSMMLSEDHSALANLPQDVKYHPWPKAGHYVDYELDDTIRGIDKQLDEDGAEMKRNKGGNKW